VALAAAAALVLALGVGAFWLRRPASTVVEAPAQLETPGAQAPVSAPPAGVSGTLVIDALPWGEVVSVTDARGVRHEPKTACHTPLALSLAAGDYTVEVRHPAFPGPLSATVSVRPGEATTRVLEFGRVDAADYFRRTGL
jgi:hypothetical protein